QLWTYGPSPPIRTSGWRRVRSRPDESRNGESQYGSRIPTAGDAAADETLRDDGLGVGVDRFPALRAARIRRRHGRRHRVRSADLRTDLLQVLSQSGRCLPIADRLVEARV